MNGRHAAPNGIAKQLKRRQREITRLLAPRQNGVDAVATGEKGEIGIGTVHPPVEPRHPQVTLAEAYYLI